MGRGARGEGRVRDGHSKERVHSERCLPRTSCPPPSLRPTECRPETVDRISTLRVPEPGSTKSALTACHSSGLLISRSTPLYFPLTPPSHKDGASRSSVAPVTRFRCAWDDARQFRIRRHHTSVVLANGVSWRLNSNAVLRDESAILFRRQRQTRRRDRFSSGFLSGAGLVEG